MCFSDSKYTLYKDTRKKTHKEEKEKNFRKKNGKEFDELNVMSRHILEMFIYRTGGHFMVCKRFNTSG